MFGIDPLTVSSLFILAGNAISCPRHPPTRINVVPQTEKVKYDYKQSLKQIQTYSIDTVDPYAYHGKTVTQGFMRGGVSLEHKMEFGQDFDVRRGYACIWYKNITVTLKVEPTIVIAKELYKDRCMRQAILNHEMKHVRVDREVINKYAKSIGRKLTKELKSRGFSAGPMHVKDAQGVSEKMQRVVGQILDLEYQKLDIERQERQRGVDSLGEYQRVDDKCPAFEKKKEQLYADLLR